MPKKSLPKQSFEERYPNISRWVNRENGMIEIGWRDDGYCSGFVRAYDIGGSSWEGVDEYDYALLALEGGVQELMREIHGDSWESE